MEETINYSPLEITKMEIRSFVSEGLLDVYNNNLLDFKSGHARSDYCFRFRCNIVN